MFYRNLKTCLLALLLGIGLIGCSGGGGNNQISGGDYSIRMVARASNITFSQIRLLNVIPMTYVRPKTYRVRFTHVALCQDLSGTNAWSIFDGTPYTYTLSGIGSEDDFFEANGVYPPESTTFNCLEATPIWVETTVTVHNWSLLGDGDFDVAFRVYMNDDSSNSAQRGDVTVVVNNTEKWIKSDYSGFLNNRSDGTPYQTSSIPQVGDGTDHNGNSERVLIVDGKYVIRTMLGSPLITGTATGKYTFTLTEDISQGFGFTDTTGDGKFDPDEADDGLAYAGSQPTYSTFTLTHN